jgi:hypothetical protein
MIINPKTVKLGKLAPKHDARTFKLERYVKLVPPSPPQASYQAHVKNWPMMLNDSLGDCTCACAGHMIEQWTAYNGGSIITPPDSSILTAYEAVGGYNPGDPSTDNGANILDVLNYWRKTGIDGHKILGYATVNTANLEEVKQAVYLFGNIYLGIQLPISAQSQDGLWTVADGGTNGSPNNAPGSWGGHAIPVVEYDSEELVIVTWGQLWRVSWNFFLDYVDEAYAVLSQDWFDKNQDAFNGFDITTLEADLAGL